MVKTEQKRTISWKELVLMKNYWIGPIVRSNIELPAQHTQLARSKTAWTDCPSNMNSKLYWRVTCSAQRKSTYVQNGKRGNRASAVTCMTSSVAARLVLYYY